MGRRGEVMLIAAACALVPAPLRADPATAESMFREGRELLKAGQIAQACVAFAESQRLDPSSGALINLAACREQEGKLASAWADFLSAARLATQEGKVERAEEAQSRALGLEPRLPKLNVRAPPSPVRASLFRDDQDLGEHAFGRDLPIDPGPHTIHVRAQNHVPWSSEVTVNEGQRMELQAPSLVAAEPPAAAAADDRAPKRPPAPAPLRPLADASVLYVTGVLGVSLGAVGMVVGAALGSRAGSLASESDALCEPVCTRAAADLNDRALLFADAATGAFIGGGIAAAAGLSLLIAGGAVDGQPASASAWLTPEGVRVGGSF